MARELVVQLKRAGRDIADLTIGEPDFPPPPHVIQAISDAAFGGATRYTSTSGTIELREAIRAKFRRENGISYGTDEIIVGSGAKQLIHAAMGATVQVGDEVIVPAPYWVSYPDLVRLHGATPVFVDCAIERGFKLIPEQLESAISPRTRWLVINSPNNPSGGVYDADELRALGEVLARHERVWVLTDEIYEHFCYDGTRTSSLATAAPHLRDRILTVNGVSKTYGMTGFRIGYAGGPRELMRAIEVLLMQSTSCPSSIGQAAAVAALEGPQDCVRGFVTDFSEKRDLLVSSLSDVEGVEVTVPSGAFYVYLGVRELLSRSSPGGRVLRTDADVASYLLEHGGVATVAGDSYGLSPYLRLSFAGPRSTVADGARRIAEALAELDRRGN
ncbi:MAG: pyridoxal phosphate-dependent aminotransferase [Burkholderiaceae bacterium]|nr:pyridoxal phosphate-dependent aminotransferase [Burkholderiaceae bacterium]